MKKLYGMGRVMVSAANPASGLNWKYTEIIVNICENPELLEQHSDQSTA